MGWIKKIGLGLGGLLIPGGLGRDRFNLRDFNEMILANGAMPLGILSEVVEDWVAEVQAG